MIKEWIDKVLDNISRVIVGKRDSIKLALIALLCEGHILIEDIPGIGKTTFARALARSVSCSFRRIQFTPDVLPSDIVGVYYFNQKTNDFEFRPGPIMANIVLADEINRATPRTQSCLLECMQEYQVTVEGVTRELPRPFMVIATQNPIELEGTFPLPEAQLDRFMMRVKLGYPSKEEEDIILLRFQGCNPLDKLEPVLSIQQLLNLQRVCEKVYVEKSIRAYILDIVRATRENPNIALGLSPRATLHLFKACKALAAMEGRDYVIPDDVKFLATPVLAHRIILNTESQIKGKSKEDIINNIISVLSVPVEG
ncbi:MAG: MoxR family ATPase [Nitrososphaerales archaeon]